MQKFLSKNWVLVVIVIVSAIKYGFAQDIRKINGVYFQEISDWTYITVEDVRSNDYVTFDVDTKFLKTIIKRVQDGEDDIAIAIIKNNNRDNIKYYEIPVRIVSYGQPGSKNRQIKFFASIDGFTFAESVWMTRKKVDKLLGKS